MIVLDTNVISEVFRPAPEPAVVRWLESLTGEVAITAVTMAELLAGVARLPEGRRKDGLLASIAGVIADYRGTGAVLPFDDAAAAEYGSILATREANGIPISTADAQIASICRAHGAVLATRNLKDFGHTGVELVDPWEASVTG